MKNIYFFLLKYLSKTDTKYIIFVCLPLKMLSSNKK